MIENKDQGVAEKDPVFEYEKLIRKPIFIMSDVFTCDNIDSYPQARAPVADSLQVEL